MGNFVSTYEVGPPIPDEDPIENLYDDIVLAGLEWISIIFFVGELG